MSMDSAGSGETSIIGDRFGGLKKTLRRRLSAALSNADFECCDPPTCVSVLHVASIQVTRR